MNPTNGTPTHSSGAAHDQAEKLRRMMRESPERVRPASASNTRSSPLPHTPTIAVASGKGGVGKTTISVNVSVALSRSGRRIALLDGDLGLGNADVLCGVSAQHHLGHVLAGRRTIDQVAIDVADRCRLIPGASGVARLADLRESERRNLIDAITPIARWSDALVIDCGAGIGPGVLDLAGIADTVLVVTTPEPTAVTDAYALIKCLARATPKEGFVGPDLGLVVNSATSLDQARDVHQRVAGVAGRFLAIDLPLFGVIPSDEKVARAVRQRRPLVIADPGARASRAISLLADRLAASIPLTPEERGRAGWLARLLRTGKHADGRKAEGPVASHIF